MLLAVYVTASIVALVIAPLLGEAHVTTAAESLTAYGTMFLAVGTFVLAFASWRMANLAAKARIEDDNRHQDHFTPIVKFTVKPSPEKVGSEITLSGTLMNYGTSPALNVTLVIEAREHDFSQQTITKSAMPEMNYGPVGVGEELPIKYGVTQRSETLNDWTVTLKYENIFGLPASTVYSSGTSRIFYFRPIVVIRSKSKMP